MIRDCEFEFLHVHHKSAINLANSAVYIDNIETRGGGAGIDFGGSLELRPSSGSVVNSRFFDSGILVQYSDSTRIANNVFENSSISVELTQQGLISALTIEENEFRLG